MLKIIEKFIANRILVGASVVVILVAGYFGWRLLAKNKQNQQQYQTAQAEKGTLIVSITASGQVSAANNTSVTTQASGVVSQVYVQNDQVVKVGDKIAELDLDLDGKQRTTQAWSSYQSAQNNLASAKASLYTLQSDMFSKWDTFKTLAESGEYENSDNTPREDMRSLPEFHISQDDWLATEAKYKNQQNVVAQAQTALSSAWSTYQKASPVIYAPISGTVTGLSLQEGTVLVSQSNTSGTATAQKIASIKTNAAAQLTVNLTEIDIPKIKIGNKATITLDALPGKTYTGKVISIDTIGAISSGVTSYPAVIGLDSEAPQILPNMSVQANIITQVKDNVVLVPASAVQTQNGQSFVRILKNNQIQQVNVETGLSSSTQIEITSGLTEGETVVTSIIANGGTAQVGNNQTTSPFSGMGGGAFRMGR